MTTSHNTKQNATSKPPGPPLRTSPTTLVSASAVFSGTHAINLDANVIIQLRSRLSSIYGPITIGEGSIISERASIGLLTASTNSESSKDAAKPASSGVDIGAGVVVESGAILEASEIGAFTTIEAGAIVGKGAAVGERCKICARVKVGEGCVVPDGMVVWGSRWGEWRAEQRVRELDGKKESWVREQGEMLRRIWTGK